jgi:hypothetical protein
METKQKDKRKVLLFLPVLVLPFLTLAFYAMGGGTAGFAQSTQPVQRGINTELPDAIFKKEEPVNKMGIYRQNDLESTKNHNNGIKTVADHLGFNRQEEDPRTEQINRKLQALNKEIARPAEPAAYRTGTLASKTPSASMKSDVDRLEALMKTMREDKQEDPEMAQLTSMMDKIISIQNPELVQQKLKTQQATSPDSLFKAIPAIIVNKQQAIQGATVKLRLQDTIRINGQLIPKGHDLFGICRITNQRLLLDIKNIRLGIAIIPVDLSVYSLDGMPGIYAPEAELAGAAGNGADNAVRSIDLYGIDQTITTQVAGAGIDAAKSLLSKKIKRVKVKLEAGREILLRNNQVKTR